MESAFIVGIIAMLLLFGVAPGIVFTFIRSMRRGKEEVRKLELQKEIAQLELEKGAQKLRLLELENANLDKIIGE